MKLLAFDLETAKQIPEGETDWKAHRPLGITCAAAADSEGEVWQWYASDDNDQFTPKMTEEEAQLLVKMLTILTKDCGYTLVTWNGLGFDFDILAEESGLFDECKELALNHVDLMFQFFLRKGLSSWSRYSSQRYGAAWQNRGRDRRESARDVG